MNPIQAKARIDIPFVDLLSWTFGNSSINQEKDIYIDAHDDRIRISVLQARALVKKLISGFKARGLRDGDCVCLHAFNSVWYSILWLSIIGAGGCVVGSNPCNTNLELKLFLSETRSRYIIVEPDLLDSILPAARECGIHLENMFILNTRTSEIPKGFGSWKALLRYGASNWKQFNDKKLARSTIAALLYTSGSSGTPKAAALSHFNLVARNASMLDDTTKPYEVSRLVCLPMFQALILPTVHIASIREGLTTYIMRRYDTTSYLKYISRYQITEVAMVPQMVSSILLSPVSPNNLLTSLRDVFCGGAPLDKIIRQRIVGILPPEVRFTQGWGMSETGRITYFPFPEQDDTGSVGRLLPNTETKIVDDLGNDVVEDGRPGEILIRGPSIMIGYVGRPDASKEAFTGNWLRTGDFGYCNGGKWYITDRLKDLIKVRSWQVSPTELENCLLSHPDIVDAAVIGVKAEGQIETPCAYVVRRHKSSLSQEDIQGWVSARLAKYKQLTGGVKIMKSLPRAVNGKILRAKLLENQP